MSMYINAYMSVRMYEGMCICRPIYVYVSLCMCKCSEFKYIMFMLLQMNIFYFMYLNNVNC